MLYSRPDKHVCVVRQTVNVATDAFKVLLETHKWISMPSLASRTKSTSSEGGAERPGTRGERTGGERDGGPPYVLMEHVPLAVYTNGLLGALNEFRHCAPFSLKAPTARALQVRAV